MRHRLTLVLVSLIALLLVAAPIAAQSIKPNQGGTNIDLASSLVRKELTRGMGTFAREMDVDIELERIGWSSSGAFVMAFAPVANLEDLTDEDLARGVDYGVTYRTALKDRLVSDYFLVRMQGEPGSDTVTLEFVNRKGEVAMRTEGTMQAVTGVEPHTPKILVGVQDNDGAGMPATRRDVIIIDIDTWVVTETSHWIIGEHTHTWIIIPV